MLNRNIDPPIMKHKQTRKIEILKIFCFFLFFKTRRKNMYPLVLSVILYLFLKSICFGITIRYFLNDIYQ